MNGIADFTVVADRGFFRPTGSFTLDGTIALIAEALTHAREQGLKQLLVDSRKITGHQPPDTFQRYYLMNRWMEAANAQVQLALIVRPEMLDPQRFELRVAENRGFLVNSFLDDDEAIAWLDGK